MRLLILGGSGMLGHQLLKHFQNRYDVRVTLRQSMDAYNKHHLFNTKNSYFDIDVRRDADLLSVFSDYKPHVVMNAVGMVKQREQGKEAMASLEINALLPHRLISFCKALKMRLIHISTDCVFSGRKGQYVENDCSDAEDIYGRTKYLGEVNTPFSITLRTSLIGLELSRQGSLIEWFMNQQGKIKGFQRAIYTGLTTCEMSRVIEKIIFHHPVLSGIWHVASHSINKYNLLTLLAKLLDRQDIDIEIDDQFFCDRSLKAYAFNQETGYEAPSWDMMLSELVDQINERNGKRTIVEMKCSA